MPVNEILISNIGCYHSQELAAIIHRNWLLSFTGIGCYHSQELAAIIHRYWLLSFPDIGCYHSQVLAAIIHRYWLLSFQDIGCYHSQVLVAIIPRHWLLSFIGKLLIYYIPDLYFICPSIVKMNTYRLFYQYSIRFLFEIEDADSWFKGVIRVLMLLKRRYLF
jgi:hypothetical protein